LKTKIASFDIETFPETGYFFDLWKEGNIVRITEHSYMLCWTIKYLDGRLITRSLPDYQGYKPGSKDDSKLVKELHDLFEEADILIAHNGDRFDIKESNKRFIFHGLTPPSPYKTIDTLKIAKRNFKFISNKLDDLGQFLGVGAKVKHPGFDMWIGCEAGDEKSWNLMRKYNRQDVILLEAVYHKLKPWHQTHPSNKEDGHCNNCPSIDLKKEGTKLTRSGTVQQLRCRKCGAWKTEKYVPA
jgi:DNA polymerase elongation subunit (family B)